MDLAGRWGLAGAPVTSLLQQLLAGNADAAGLLETLRLAAADNGASFPQLLKDAKDMYNTLSKPLHMTNAGHTGDAVQVEFAHGGTSSLLAYAVIMHASGRKIRLYDGPTLFPPFKLRALPANLPRASAAELQAMPLLLA